MNDRQASLASSSAEIRRPVLGSNKNDESKLLKRPSNPKIQPVILSESVPSPPRRLEALIPREGHALTTLTLVNRRLSMPNIATPASFLIKFEEVFLDLIFSAIVFSAVDRRQ